MDEARQHDGDRDEEKRDDEQRAEEADGKIALRVFGFLRGGGHAVESDVGEENRPGAAEDAAPPVLPEGAAVRWDERGQVGHGLGAVAEKIPDTETDEREEHADLDRDHQVVEVGGLLNPDEENIGQDQRDEDRWKVDDRAGQDEFAAFEVQGCAHQRMGNGDVELVQDLVDGPGPTDGDGRTRNEVFEDETPADDPREHFAEAAVGVGVGAAGDGDHRGEFGVTKSGEKAGDAGDDVGQGDGGPTIEGGCRARLHEDARADNRADAEADEADRAERAFVAVLG